VGNIKFKLDTSTNEFDEVFFNRPVSRLQASWVGVVSSKNTSLKSISSIYQILDLLGQNVTLVVDQRQMHATLPADVVLKPKKTPGYTNSDEGIESLRNCKIIIFLAETELNSDMELFMNQLLKVYSGTIITDSYSVFNEYDFKGDKVLTVNDKQISSRYQEGLNHLSALIQSYSLEVECPIVYFGKNQIICINNKNIDTACVINTKKVIDRNEFVGILAGMMADKKTPVDNGWLKYCQASGFLLRLLQSDGLAAVKKYLDSKF
jgi:hypothetical protein